ncbi:MAG: hypothetical protein RLY86_1363, partial [Pseudomonadota bacterium]
MAFSIAEALGPLLSLVIVGLFSATVVYLARLHRRLGALRGAQSELHGLLRACSDNVDATERSIAALRGAAQTLAADLGRSLDRAEALKAEIDTTCAAADRLLSRLAEAPRIPSPPEGEGGARPERSAGWEGEGSGSTGLRPPAPDRGWARPPP